MSGGVYRVQFHGPIRSVDVAALPPAIFEYEKLVIFPNERKLAIKHANAGELDGAAADFD
jgi:hypothetical protein